MQKKLRLTHREDFNKVYRRGKSFANHQFVLYVSRNPQTEQFRLGISVSKKVGNAVIRNRMRRLIKEIVRLDAERLNPGLDLILIVRKPAIDMEYEELRSSILHVMKKAEIVLRKK